MQQRARMNTYLGVKEQRYEGTIFEIRGLGISIQNQVLGGEEDATIKWNSGKQEYLIYIYYICMYIYMIK